MVEQAPPVERLLRVAVAGNPNAGKSSLFNCLTGLRQKVGNYPGVTVERKIGRCRLDDVAVEVIDLPGAYSLTVQSPDEQIARDVLFGWLAEHEPPPDVVLVVVDATNLQRNLFLATQILELGYPAVIALNMADIAAKHGLTVDVDALSRALGVPVVKTVASRGEGVERLRATLLEAAPSKVRVPLDPAVAEQVTNLTAVLQATGDVPPALVEAMALRLLTSPQGPDICAQRYGAAVAAALAEARGQLVAAGTQWQGCEAASRYAWLTQVVDSATHRAAQAGRRSTSDKIDRVLTHRFFGPLIFMASMAIVFQSIYTWAAPVMKLIDGSMTGLSGWVEGHLPAGVARDLLANGVITGVGAVLVFLPQIVMLFLFLALLEDSGYMARAAFVMDRIMSKVGLHGRSFVPLLSSFACAIPGILATRTIASKRDRLTTILVAPLITCSARLPIYALLIAAFVPSRRVCGGLLGLQGLTLLSLYGLGVVSALVVAAVLKRTLLKGPTPALLLELPTYKVPALSHVLRDLTERSWLFVRFAGSVILSLSIVLWFLASFPHADTSRAPALAAQELAEIHADPADTALAAKTLHNIEGQLQLEHSYMGRLGHVLEPVVRPLGFDWRIGVGLVGSFAAREVMVSTMGILFAVGKEATETDRTLIDKLHEARRADGRPLFTVPVVASLLIFYVFACQCMSTVSVTYKETGGWRWPAFMMAYMFVLAYSASLLTYQGLRALGVG